MENLSGKGDYREMMDQTIELEKAKKKKYFVQEEVQYNSVKVLPKEEVTQFVNSYHELLQQCEKLYDSKCLKTLHDIKIILGSLKRDINALPNFADEEKNAE